MPKTNTNSCDGSSVKAGLLELSELTSSAFELVNWSVIPSSTLLSSALPSVRDNVFALQTTRLCAPFILPIQNEKVVEEKSPFVSFNLGLHVGDVAGKVAANRNQLTAYISQQLAIEPSAESMKSTEPLKVQWLEQVHGNHVTEVTTVSSHAITADASITRQKNIALAIMTADCLPILLSHKEGAEIAAIHGGWRPLAANIIKETIEKMHSKPTELVAWLGPCIGNESFEVGIEVKEAFTQQDKVFTGAFVKQKSGKYLADLHKIAQIQLQSLGVRYITTLDECTYQRTDKYYSYRKEQVTGRMASLICRR